MISVGYDILKNQYEYFYIHSWMRMPVYNNQVSKELYMKREIIVSVNLNIQCIELLLNHLLLRLEARSYKMDLISLSTQICILAQSCDVIPDVFAGELFHVKGSCH